MDSQAISYTTSLLTACLTQLGVSTSKVRCVREVLERELHSLAVEAAPVWELRIPLCSSPFPPKPFLTSCLLAGIPWSKWRAALSSSSTKLIYYLSADKAIVLAPALHVSITLWQSPSSLFLESLEQEIEDVPPPSPSSSSSSDNFWSSSSASGVSSSDSSVHSSPTQHKPQGLPEEPCGTKWGTGKFAWPPIKSEKPRRNWDSGRTGVLSGGVSLSANPKNGLPRK